VLDVSEDGEIERLRAELHRVAESRRGLRDTLVERENEITALRARVEKADLLLEQAHRERERLDVALGKVLKAYRGEGFAAQISAVIQLREVMEDLSGETGTWTVTPDPGQLEQP